MVLARNPSELDQQRISMIMDEIYEWKVALPSQLRVESVKNWSEEGLWILVLMAWCYRLKCNVYHTLRKAMNDGGDSIADVVQRFHTAIFELDIIVKRAVTHHIGKLLPMSL
jgi:hypothetical protein